MNRSRGWGVPLWVVALAVAILVFALPVLRRPTWLSIAMGIAVLIAFAWLRSRTRDTAEAPPPRPPEGPPESPSQAPPSRPPDPPRPDAFDPPAGATPGMEEPPLETLGARLQTLERLRRQGLISAEEYEARRARAIAEF